MTHRPWWQRAGRAALAAVAVLAGASACSLQTAGAPKGNLILHAEFNNVDQLVPGHSVRIAAVTVGSVTNIRLDGYKALVTMAVDPKVHIPDDAAAVLKQTSLLGENFIDLEFPPGDKAPALRSGATLTNVSVAPDLEQLTQQSIAVFGALSARDMGAAVHAAAVGFGGHADDMKALLSDMQTFGGMLSSQSGEIGSLIDNFERAVAPFAQNTATVQQGIDAVNQASQVLAANRNKMVVSTEQLLSLAAATNNTILGPATDTTIRALTDLSVMFGVLVQNRNVLDRLIVDNYNFTTKVGDAVRHGAEQSYSQPYSDNGPQPPSGGAPAIGGLLSPKG